MSNVRVADVTRNNRLNAVRDRIDSGPGAGVVEIRSGTQPADADDAAVGTLLATLTLADPSAPNAASGVLTFNAITEDSSADATGTASWGRVKTSDGNTVFDCDVGTSGTTIVLNTVSIVVGGPVRITSFTLTDPTG